MDKIQFITYLKQLFSFLLSTNIINFGIMVWLLYKLLRKINISRIFDKSIDNVKKTIKDSQDTKMLAQKNLSNSCEVLKKLPIQIEQIEQFNAQKNEIFLQKVNENTQKSIENLNKNIEKNIKTAEEKISTRILGQTIMDSIEKSKLRIIDELKKNPQLHADYIQESLKELERLEI